MSSRTKVMSGVLLDDLQLTLGELCRLSGVHAEAVLEMVGEGILEPRGRGPRRWRFSAAALKRVRVVQRLQRDLDVNLAGAALVLELLEELDELRARLRQLERR